jgi:hypothetical protein
MKLPSPPWGSKLESKETVPEVVRLLIESLRALAHARAIEEPRRHRLDQRLNELLDSVSPASR